MRHDPDIWEFVGAVIVCVTGSILGIGLVIQFFVYVNQ